MTEDQTETAIRTTSYVHLPANTRVNGTIRTQTNGDRYMVLDISAKGVGDVTFFIHDPEILDKLSNEADRLCREFVGDVPDVIPDDCPNCKSDDCECLSGATL